MMAREVKLREEVRFEEAGLEDQERHRRQRGHRPAAEPSEVGHQRLGDVPEGVVGARGVVRRVVALGVVRQEDEVHLVRLESVRLDLVLQVLEVLGFQLDLVVLGPGFLVEADARREEGPGSMGRACGRGACGAA